ncbi:hypothetical protein Tco_1456445 [Tanacetum coccineum]
MLATLRAEDWITHMESCFKFWVSEKLQDSSCCVYNRSLSEENYGDSWRGSRLAVLFETAVEMLKDQDRHFMWGLKKWVLSRGSLIREYTNVAHVAAAARNIELLHGRVEIQ